MYRGTPMEQITMHEWQMMLDVNYTGVFVCTKAIAPVFKQQRSRSPHQHEQHRGPHRL